MGWESRTHPFKQVPLFVELQKLPREVMHSRLADPNVRAEMLAQAEGLLMEDSLQGRMVKMMFSNMKFYYPIPPGDGWDYEPLPEMSIHAIAQREGRSGFEVAYDAMMENGGRGVIWRGFPDVPSFYDDAKLNLLHEDCVPVR